LSATQQTFDPMSILNIASYMLFFVFIVYGQKIQITLTANSLSKSLKRLEVMKNTASKEAVRFFTDKGSTTQGLSERIERVLDYVTIMPEGMDPKGIVGKLEHITNTGSDRLRSEVKTLLNTSDRISVSAGENLLEIASALNMIHKIARHYFLVAKKTNSYITLLQLQMNMPQILKEAEALVGAVDAIKQAQPLGDGIGPLVASRFMTNLPNQVVAKDTIFAQKEYKGRTLYVLKAEGPMGYVGEVGEAMTRIVEGMGVSINKIIMVDAALKLEGEKTGEIAEGVGAAIGGIGVDKFQIEEVAAKHKVPIYAVLVKQSILEAITVMRKEIAEASDKVVAVVGRVIEEKTKEGDKILLAGIGNSLGVGQ
jgi:hypothetical protein